MDNKILLILLVFTLPLYSLGISNSFTLMTKVLSNDINSDILYKEDVPPSFDSPPAEFTGNFSDYGLDTDDDGLYNYLVVEVGVNVSEPGEYIIQGNLRYYNETTGEWEWLHNVGSENFSNLSRGIHNVSLQFFMWPSVHELKYNGIFNVQLELRRITDDGRTLDCDTFKHTTLNIYNYSSFQIPDGYSLDYFNITIGHGIKYHVTDDWSNLDCYVWAVSQYFESNKPHDIDFVFTLVDEGFHGGYFCDSSMAGRIWDLWGRKVTTFNHGYPVGNQANFYFDFCLPTFFFKSGDRWSFFNRVYYARWIGNTTVNGNFFEDCIRVDMTLTDEFEYLDGNGYFILARDVGIVKLVFNRTNGENVLFEYVDEKQFTGHNISGMIRKNGTPVEDIVVQISNADWGIRSVTDEFGNFSLHNIYGPDIVLRIGYDNDSDGVFDFDDYPGYPKEIDLHGIKSNIDGLIIDISTDAIYPIADFEWYIEDSMNQTIRFNSTSFDLDGIIVNWTWDFGDGNISYKQNPIHQYESSGTYNVTLTVIDDDNLIAKCSKIITIGGTPPTTIKTVGNPRYGPNDEFVTSHTEFNFTTVGDFSGTSETFYRIWYNDIWSNWIEYTGNFTLSGEGKHYLEYYSVDNAGNIEDVHNQTHYVDDSPPITSISYGIPFYTNGTGTWITTFTSIYLNAIDEPEYGCGVNHTYYRIDNGKWIEYTKPFTIDKECSHIIEYYSVDHLGNIEDRHVIKINVDSSPPRTTIDFGSPSYKTEGETWISSSTSIYLSSSDYPICTDEIDKINHQVSGGCGVNKTFYRVYKEGEKPPEFSVYTGPFSIDEECTHIIEFYSVDNLGNAERVRTRVVKVDNSPPETNLTIGDPHLYKGNSLFVTSHTPFKFTSNDTGEYAVGVKNILYRVWDIQTGWSDWMIFNPIISVTEGIPIIDGKGLHYVEYYSTDLVDNAESIHNLTCYADNTPPKSRAHCMYPRYIYIEAEDIGRGDMEPAVGGYRIHYRYKIGDENWTDWQVGGENENIVIRLSWPDNTAPIDIPIHVEYYAVDALGNTENTHHDIFTLQRSRG
ncbi:MAG: hypothetical protein DRN19_00590 [Thermoplasmata archaeon]|nr:MAG: hypothetical protein DRN19_00590 [Thermoplasmata archaeon]